MGELGDIIMGVVAVFEITIKAFEEVRTEFGRGKGNFQEAIIDPKAIQCLI